jgi:hypothetical protein
MQQLMKHIIFVNILKTQYITFINKLLKKIVYCNEKKQSIDIYRMFLTQEHEISESVQFITGKFFVNTCSIMQRGNKVALRFLDF